MKRPNAMIFMTLSGIAAGAVLGGTYVLMLMLYWAIGSTSLVNTLGFGLFGALLAASVGAQSGGVLGFLIGFLMDWQVRRMSWPLSRPAIQAFRKRVGIMIFFVGGIGFVLTFLWRFRGLQWNLEYDGQSLLFMAVIPALITFAVAQLTAHLYINRLIAWDKPKHL